MAVMLRLRRAAPWLLLALAILLGVLLRLAPTLGRPGTQFLADGATIARLAVDASRTGRLPAVDSLAEAPAGRPLGPYLPPGFIVSAGILHRALGARDANFDLALFGALCGGLIALPVFFWTRFASGGRRAAPIAALLAVIVPAHLHRTFGYLMRYDAPGSLAVITFLALVAGALASTARRERVLFGLAAGVALALAAWTWRVSLLAPVLVVGFAAAWTIARGEAEATREWLTPLVLVATALLPAIEYLGIQRYVLSPARTSRCNASATRRSVESPARWP